MGKSIFEILNTNNFLLNSKERIKVIFTLFFLFSFFSLIISFFIGLTKHSLFFSFFLGFESIIFWACLNIALSPIYKKYSNMFSSDNTKNYTLSFEGIIIYLLIIGLGGFSFWLIQAYFIGPFFPFLGFAFSFIIPVLFMYVRKDVFHESSKTINCSEEGIGYYPLLYYFYGMALSLLPFAFSFGRFGSYLKFGVPNIILCIILLLFSFLMIFLFFCPDVWNKILPFDIRLKKGSIAYFLIWFVFEIVVSLIFWKYYF